MKYTATAHGGSVPNIMANTEARFDHREGPASPIILFHSDQSDVPRKPQKQDVKATNSPSPLLLSLPSDWHSEIHGCLHLTSPELNTPSVSLSNPPSPPPKVVKFSVKRDGVMVVHLLRDIYMARLYPGIMVVAGSLQVPREGAPYSLLTHFMGSLFAQAAPEIKRDANCQAAAQPKSQGLCQDGIQKEHMHPVPAKTPACGCDCGGDRAQEPKWLQPNNPGLYLGGSSSLRWPTSLTGWVLVL